MQYYIIINVQPQCSYIICNNNTNAIYNHKPLVRSADETEEQKINLHVCYIIDQRFSIFLYMRHNIFT